MLIKQEDYLGAGIHIGTKLKVVDMNRFIYRTRNDGLYVLDLRKIDERIRLAAKELGKFEPKDILVVASRTYSSTAAAKFCELTGCKLMQGRFIPGILTNVARKDFMEPKLIFVCDPKGERQAVLEAGQIGIPIIGLCDTDNFTSFVDWVIPCNNKGKRSLALIFYLLARELAMSSGKISSYDEFTTRREAFEGIEIPIEQPAPEVQVAEVAAPAAEAEAQKEAEAKKPKKARKKKSEEDSSEEEQ